MGFGLSDDAGDHFTCMNTDLDTELRGVAKRLRVYIALYTAGKICDSHGVMATK